MKILLVNDYAAPRGGAEVLTLALRDGLRARGHQVKLLASTAGTDASGSSADYHCFGTTGRLGTYLQAYHPGAARAMRAALDDFAPDLVHVRMFLTQMSPSILPALRGVPSLCHVVWYKLVCPTGRKLLPDFTECRTSAGTACLRNGCVPVHHWPSLMLQRRLLRQWRDAFDLTIANSDSVRRQLEREGIAVDSVVPNGVPVRDHAPTPAEHPIVLFAGRLVPEKGVDGLLRAFAAVSVSDRSARLEVAGDGPQRAELEALTRELGLGEQVRFLGHLAADELAAHRARAWMQVVPSRWAEPFGIVAVEAMMDGVPVIATRCGGLADIVDHDRTGLLVEAGDDAALAAAIQSLAAHPDRARELGAAARRAATERYGDSVLFDRLTALYQRLAG